MQEETKGLMIIATTYEDPGGDKERTKDTRKKARECVLFDLERAGEHKILWQMQFEDRLGREFQVDAGLAAVEVWARAGRTIELMHYRGLSPFQEVNRAIIDEIIRDELRGKGFTKAWQADDYRRMRTAQMADRQPSARMPRQIVARA